MSIIIYLLKNSELRVIKKKLVLLYLLNVSDTIFTLLLVGTGQFIEVNIIMAHLVNNNKLLVFMIKTVVPLILFMWIYNRMKRASQRQLARSNIVITGATAFYGFINIMHVLWCLLYSIMWA